MTTLVALQNEVVAVLEDMREIGRGLEKAAGLVAQRYELTLSAGVHGGEMAGLEHARVGQALVYACKAFGVKRFRLFFIYFRGGCIFLLLIVMIKRIIISMNNTAERSQQQAEALNRAVSGLTMTNYPAIFDGFMQKGIPEDQIQPRENVFTFNAWKALGRSVKKGEHGVKVITWVTAKGKETEQDGEAVKTAGFRFCRTTTVFHISQTKEIN